MQPPTIYILQSLDKLSSKYAIISATMKQYISFAALLLLSLHHLQDSEAAIQCSDVLKGLTPCVSYLSSTGSGSPSATCCSGVSAVAASVSTTADRRAACSCIMSAVSQINNPNLTAAAALPGKCGVTLPFAISANIDCSKIS